MTTAAEERGRKIFDYTQDERIYRYLAGDGERASEIADRLGFPLYVTPPVLVQSSRFEDMRFAVFSRAHLPTVVKKILNETGHPALLRRLAITEYDIKAIAEKEGFPLCLCPLGNPNRSVEVVCFRPDEIADCFVRAYRESPSEQVLVLSSEEASIFSCAGVG